ncbi:unnamed protein product [Euphydryas editha]|uniref:Uncharacterized protein n=1 Tax=Euphydryas editha TaxID=104508 RepID=A0AAU9UPX9_EUPED|nr:unnamed protein product [Euphydryas editha]
MSRKEEACYTREELEGISHDESDNEEDEEGDVDDPLLVQEHMEVQEDPESIPNCRIPSRLLDKESLYGRNDFSTMISIKLFSWEVPNIHLICLN